MIRLLIVFAVAVALAVWLIDSPVLMGVVLFSLGLLYAALATKLRAG